MDTPKAKINQWFLAFKKRGSDIFDLSGLQKITPPADHYQADPFLFKYKGVNYIFHELYDYQKGKIAFSIITDPEHCTFPRICLERPYHLSFPFLIEDQGEVYMLLETGQANCIEIYKASDFPFKWERVKTLVPDVCAGDSVIYKRKDGYFLFTTISGDRNLTIYRADSLLGEYTIAWSNEIQNSRPAGNMFDIDGKTFRPVQDETKNYGGGMIVKEVSFLPYQETEVRKIKPWLPELIGCHTFNFNEDYVILDGKIKL